MRLKFEIIIKVKEGLLFVNYCKFSMGRRLAICLWFINSKLKKKKFQTQEQRL